MRNNLRVRPGIRIGSAKDGSYHLYPGPRARGEAYQHDRRDRGRCRGQPLRWRNRHEEFEKIRQELVKHAAGNVRPRTDTESREDLRNLNKT
jgi:hypothetical protein